MSDAANANTTAAGQTVATPTSPEKIEQSARFAHRLHDGVGADEPELRRALGLSPEAPDRELAHALVKALAAQTLARVCVSPNRASDTRVSSAPEVRSAADSSFLGRLSTSAIGRDTRPGVAELDDVRTLVAVMRAGTLAQRRAAVVRLGARLAEGALSNDEARAIVAALGNVHDVEIAFEVSHASEVILGAIGREARQETEAFAELRADVEPRVRDFWAGQSTNEPIAWLPPDQRAELMLRLRDAPDVVLRHIASILDGSGAETARPARLALLTSVRYSGDGRLVPPLVAFLASRAADFVPDAARALARIDDARAHPAIAAAFERSVFDAERATLAGALGIAGDVRGRDYVRGLLASDDERVRLAAVEAISFLATTEDFDRLTALLEANDPVLLGHAIRALGRAGHARGLLKLRQLRERRGLSALFADTESAEDAIRAAMELRGEEPSEDTESFALASASARGIAERARDPAVVRFRSWLDFVTGHLWLAVGAARSAIARFERGAGRRPGWAAPITAIALHHARHDRPAQALTAFRRSLEADRAWVEHNVFAIRTLARVFLRRADEVERDGRFDIARGLIEEVLALDLRRVPSELRFELRRRHEQLRARGTGT